MKLADVRRDVRNAGLLGAGWNLAYRALNKVTRFMALTMLSVTPETVDASFLNGRSELEHRFLGAASGGELTADLVASLGAGIFEELVFRLAMLSVLCLLLVRVCDALRISRVFALLVAVLGSAVVFSAFHHLGPGAPPYEQGVFLFRTAAGILLGLLFVVRGFAVAVYTHALYDVHYYLTHP